MMADHSEESGNFTIPDFVKWARVGNTTARALIKDGKLPAFKCGKRILIRKDDAEAWRAGLQRVGAKAQKD